MLSTNFLLTTEQMFYILNTNICSILSNNKEGIFVERAILHSDINNCYASIECLYDPSLCGKPVAVGGSVEMRHGIILAKSEQAKRCGVTTGEAIWQARQKCRDLIVVPPHFDRYTLYSGYVQDIYRRYTDEIEPFGLDECWLDVTGSGQLFGSGKTIAEEIRNRVRKELGITVSVGVSFNKVFAKLGSDLKKPDAVTVIPQSGFREKIWNLPASAMLGCGRATVRKLSNFGVHTIGQLAACDRDFLQAVFGKMGLELWKYANGLDDARVKPDGFTPVSKSIGHGTTCVRDLENEHEVWLVMLALTQEIGRRLYGEKLAATAVQIGIKNSDLFVRQFQTPLPLPTQSAFEIASGALTLFHNAYRWERKVRSVTVRAINLVPASAPVQTDLFSDFARHERQQKIDETVLRIRQKYGKKGIFNACLLLENTMPDYKPDHAVLPGAMYK